MPRDSGGEDKVALLIDSIREIGIDGAKWIEENLDEQYKALSYLWSNLRDVEVFLKLVIMNGISSYQLSGRGELWWWEFARWFSGCESIDLPGDYIRFLEGSKYNRRILTSKIIRVARLWKGMGTLNLLPYYSRIEELWKIIADSLGTDPFSKTVVFALKMYGYGARLATGLFLPYPKNVPIPLDLRVKNFTGRVTSEDPIRFWLRVSEETGVPPLHIDSILWPLLGRPSLAHVYRERFGDIVDGIIQYLHT